jgi:hypothetical protein
MHSVPAIAAADRSVNDQAYANAMRQVHERLPDDPDISMLYVESVMDIRPWRYWMLDGEPHVHEPPRGVIAARDSCGAGLARILDAVLDGRDRSRDRMRWWCALGCGGRPNVLPV